MRPPLPLLALPCLLLSPGWALSPGVARQLNPSVQAVNLIQEGTLEATALATVQGKPLPALVLFVNEAPRMSRADTPALKRKQNAIRNSLTLLATTTDPRIEDVTMALKLYTILKVNVHGVSPESNGTVNEEKAPYAVFIDTEGKVVGVTGTESPTKMGILALLRKGTQPRLDLEKYLAKKRALLKDVVLLDSKELDLAAKRRIATSDGGKDLEKRMAIQISRLEKEIAGIQASVRKQEETIEAELQATLRRLP